ncbi:unnamed protein product, partial [marine sediment metagenome]
GYYWEPTTALGMYDMTHVGEPAYSEAVWNDNHGCAYPAVQVNICVTASLRDRAPEVVAFLENYETTDALTLAALKYMGDNDTTAEEAAIWFLQEYETLWTQWVPSDIADKVKDALSGL